MPDLIWEDGEQSLSGAETRRPDLEIMELGGVRNPGGRPKPEPARMAKRDLSWLLGAVIERAEKER
jgi:hypothetical protein